MSQEDLQSFRSHPRIWDDNEEDSATSESSSNKKQSSKEIHHLNISWPLTSFANTIQNVCCISFLMGFFFCLNLSLILLPSISNSGWRWDPVWIPLNIYFILLVVFHLLEFLTTAIFNPSRVTIDSFLLNNGSSYWFAQIFCVLEYIIRETYHPMRNKTRILERENLGKMIESIGIMLLIMGQTMRSISMITAANSFNHKVSTHTKKQDDHVLVTKGIYHFFRHPSYFGFFWWSIGLQIFLRNLFSTIIFSIVLWKFFRSRIQYEEYHLVKFFKHDYIKYRSNTPTYIPFIK